MDKKDKTVGFTEGRYSNTRSNTKCQSNPSSTYLLPQTQRLSVLPTELQEMTQPLKAESGFSVHPKGCPSRDALSSDKGGYRANEYNLIYFSKNE